MAKKTIKQRANKYEKKLKVNASFDELVAISLGKKVPLKKENKPRKKDVSQGD